MAKKNDLRSDEQKAADEALLADPIGGKPPIDVAHERAAENAEPLGYVDPESQKPVEGYAPDPADVENPPVRENRGQKRAATKKAAAAVTRADAQGEES